MMTGIINALARIMWSSISGVFGGEVAIAAVFVVESILISLVTQITGHAELFVLLLPFDSFLNERSLSLQ